VNDLGSAAPATTLVTPPAVAPALPTVEQAVTNIFDPAYHHDMFENYKVLREAGPFVPGPLGMQLVTRYREIEIILQDSAWSHAHELETLHPDSDGSDLPTSFVWTEPPDHTRIRKLASRAFTPRRFEATRERASALVEELLDAAVAAGEVDLVEAIAYPLPLTLISELIGVPAADHASVQSWSSALSRGMDPDILLTAAEIDDRQRSARAIRSYISELAKLRRAAPADDLISALALVEAESDQLTGEEMLTTLIVLLVAGHETTVSLISGALDALIRHPDQFAALHANPDLAVPAVEEIIRFCSSVHLTTRRADRDTEVSGQRFAEGDTVILLVAGGSRDPEIFAEPDRLDLARYAGQESVPRHLGFGRGHHFCIGAPMVRFQMELLLRALARRAPQMTPLADLSPYRPNLIVRGLKELRVQITED
jgi:cytochrome P450